MGQRRYLCLSCGWEGAPDLWRSTDARTGHRAHHDRWIDRRCVELDAAARQREQLSFGIQLDLLTPGDSMP